MGISSMRPGISPAVTSVRRRAAGRVMRSATGSPKLVSARIHGDLRAHPLEHPEKAGPGRVHSDAGDPKLPAFRQHSGAHQEGGGRWIARHLNVERLDATPRAELDPAVPLADGEAERPQHPLGVVTGSSVRLQQVHRELARPFRQGGASS